MAQLLLLEPDASERAFMMGALVSAGHRVHSLDDGGLGPPNPPGTRQAPLRSASLERASELGTADAIVASMDAAVARGWLRPDAVPLPVPLLVTSPFADFLRKVAPRVAGTLKKPATAEALCAAVASVIVHETVLPVEEEDILSLSDRDVAVEPFRTPDPVLVGIAELIARGAGTPMGLVTIVGSETQTFVGQAGLPVDLSVAGETPRSWSFCQHAVRARTSLVVDDAREHPYLAHTPLVEMNLVRAYAGVPVEVDGHVVGTVCALSDRPHHFDAKELATLSLAAQLVSAHFAGRRADPAPRTPAVTKAPAPFRRVMGETLDKYVITARLGAGGMSEVLLARDRVLGRLVAIKVMRDRHLSDEALLREATTLARLRHPNIVQVHGWGRTEQGELYLVLEYVEGQSLAERVEGPEGVAAPMDAESAVKIVRELGAALSTMHANGLFHGDVKPDNVILDPALDRAVLIDFGLPVGGERRGGTPGYSAPEQLVRESPLVAGPTLDVYSLAAVAYTMITGSPPFPPAVAVVAVALQLRGAVTPASELRPGLPRVVDATLSRALAGEPSRRHESVLAFVDAFADAMAGVTPAAPLDAPGVRATPSSRGAVFRRVRDEVTRLAGPAEDAAILAAMGAEDRAAYLEAAAQAGWYPARSLVAYLSAHAAGDMRKVDALATAVTLAALPRVLRTAQVARTPAGLLHIAPAVVRRYHDWARLVPVRSGTNEANVLLHVPAGYTPTMCTWVAACVRTLVRVARSDAIVTQDACTAHGADACDLRVRWGVTPHAHPVDGG